MSRMNTPSGIKAIVPDSPFAAALFRGMADREQQQPVASSQQPATTTKICYRIYILPGIVFGIMCGLRQRVPTCARLYVRTHHTQHNSRPVPYTQHTHIYRVQLYNGTRVVARWTHAHTHTHAHNRPDNWTKETQNTHIIVIHPETKQALLCIHRLFQLHLNRQANWTAFFAKLSRRKSLTHKYLI